MKALNAGILGCAVTLAGGLSSALAGPVQMTNGLSALSQYTAASEVVGVRSTGTIASGGSALYLAPMPQFSGVVGLSMDFGAAGVFVCSGSLLPDRRSILTAAHCVSRGPFGSPAPVTTVYFHNGDPDTVIYADGSPATRIGVQSTFVHPLYSGDVIDQNDVAVLRLAADAPNFALSYELSALNDLTGLEYTVAGYGRRSSAGGSIGDNLGTGRLRQGRNRFDFRFGDADFGGQWGGILGEPNSQINFSYLSDFDNGLAAQDASCRIAGAFGILNDPQYCNLGLGDLEANTAGGDSGGPSFDASMSLVAVTSYTLSFGSSFGDVLPNQNNTFGEFDGRVPVHIHRDFIRSNMVPEPSALALATLGLLFAARRRRG